MNERVRNFAFSLACIAVSAVTVTGGSGFGRPGYVGSTDQRVLQKNLIGTVTALGQAGKITVKTDAGSSVTFSTSEKTSFRRVPPGQTSLANAEAVELAAVKVGDRVLVPGWASDAAVPVKQVIIMASEAIAAQRDQQRSDWASRGITGRITAIDPAKKQLTVQSRGRSGGEAVIISVPEGAKVLRYADGSLRSEDAKPGSFSDLHVGDQVRALGDRAADGGMVTASEIVSGTVVRTFGTVTNINAAAGEITVKNEQTGRSTVVVLGPKSVVKRLPAEVARNIAQRREQRQQQRQARAESTGVQTEPAGRTARTGNEQRPRGMQQLLAAEPSLTIADVKAGDALIVVGLRSADESRVTAANVIVGDAETMRRLMPQRRNGNMSPGLPGNVAGGNVPTNDEP